MSMYKEEIIEAFGGHSNTSWDEIVSSYTGKSESEILDDLNKMWPHDDNEELAAAIHNELKYT